ncbi:carboxynorspermidine decarboxylase [Halodesulfovibrio sp. MK-HDV]|jgi:carboxyaminopropylagmatine decarboxylase|uniref:carboxynorspermidine decarboxylase n=1 Tax=Halodesulfovibrio sp. MK-HDV TaxID=2599925 RepID=UPI00136D44B1|nr:carboxynorspermidine decarboxylase [Halodesulfovibrio sp. MK-HDV]KAF1074184.1 Carboxynorspermidine/carboxyspermidine decarboxylase [Halodesulfovibrio sp. MK-HDV]
MDRSYLQKLNPERLPSPCFVVDEAKLADNAAILDSVQQRTGAKILLALKGFATYSTFPVLSGVLHGTCASSPHEARLGREEFGGEVHSFAAAYSDNDMAEIIKYSDHIVFNSFAQLRKYRPLIQASERTIKIGVRVNPQHSEGATPIYDPCSPGSRLGVRLENFDENDLEGVSGLHFHTLCEQDADALDRTLEAVEKQFGHLLQNMEWLNFGGGHHITREGYDIDRLCACIERAKARYNVQVYLEPGEAVALDAGLLVATVLDVIKADMDIAILDASAACHMPDVLEMPYRPFVIDSAEKGEKVNSYRLAGKSCLAGDVIGEYSFDTPLKAGDRLAFTDMAIYSMVKTNTFNGLQLPAIARYNPSSGDLHVVREFGYDDFRCRLS